MTRLDFLLESWRLWWNLERPAFRRVAKSRRGGPRRRRPGGEALEPRRLLATVTVSTTSDVVDGVTASITSLISNPGLDGAVSLREAIQAANNTANAGAPDEIGFAIPGSGVSTIQPTTALPTITDPVVIDGATQSGYAGEPLIELDGTSAGSANGLYITAGGSTVRGVVINRFSAYGIRLQTGGGNLIEGNDIGTDVTGTIARANGLDGIYVQDSANNMIGGVTAAARNVISGNADDGVTIGGASAIDNVLQGNFIGTDKTGTLDLGNGDEGIVIYAGASNNTVGGTATGAGAGNVVSGNGGEGIYVYNAGTSGNVIFGNLIGTNVFGDAALGNGNDGIVISDGATNNTVGGSTSGSRNVISGNAGDGVELRQAATSNNSIVGNFIGADRTGTVAVANGSDGIEIEGASTNEIGGTAAGAGNVIAGNRSDGIEMFGATATGNEFRGNFIGVDVSGNASLPNGNNGLWIGGGAANNVLGGTTIGAGNVVSGNLSDGIEFSGSGTAGNVVLGNRVGVGADGTTMLGNLGRGILVGVGVGESVIGRTQAGAGNVIAHNGAEGVFLAGDAASGNTIRGNSIFYNTKLGVDLGVTGPLPAGVTPNDAGDGDAGTNGLQNFPVLMSATTDGTHVQVNGSLNSSANAVFSIDFYSSSPPLGINEGEAWIGSLEVTTDATGEISFQISVNASVPAGLVLTATATDASGNTSEFSRGTQINNADGTPLVSIRDAGVIEGDSGSKVATFAVSLSQPYFATVTLDYATTADSATTGSDFIPQTGQLVFPAGETTRTITVPVVGETDDDESLERFFVDLTGAANATILDGRAAGWITDNDQATTSVPYGAAPQDTSEFMLGTVFVTVVFLESDGQIDPDLERLSPAQTAAMQQKIRQGLQWWEDVLALQGTVHSLDYILDFTYADNPILTPYEPLSRSSADQGLWITSFLETVGADTAASHYTDLDAYNHLRRLEANTNWAFTLFVTNGWNDPDGRYTDGANAWAYAGGPYTVIQQHRSQVTVAHEIGHIFYNLDEYPGGRSYYDRRGYYNTQNLNAYEGHPDLSQRVPSIMAETSGEAFAAHTSSTPSLEMIGWRDLDGNGVYDVLDVPLTLTGSGTYDAQTQTYHFQGNSSVQTLPNQNPSGLGNEITLNEVSRAQYRVEGADWMDIAVYQQYTAALDLIIPALPNRTLEIRTIDDASGVTSSVFAADTAANELRLELTDAPSVENSGSSAATVTRVTAETIAAPLTVTLASNDTTEATVPASVVIPAGMSSATFYVTANDDDLLDGAQSVVITASASGYVNGTGMLDVLDHETLTVVVEAAQISEEVGTSTATVARSNADNGAALLVTLISSDTTEATVPATVTIPAGQASATFSVTAVDDTLLDGTQAVTVTASSAGYVSVPDAVNVTDMESLSVAIAAASVPENAGADATTGTVTRSNTDHGIALIVILTSSETTEVTVPGTVIIPAGEASAAFSVTAVDDALLDGLQSVTVTASSTGYVSAAAPLDVTDVETLTVAVAMASVPENGGADATNGTVARSNTDNGAALVVTLTSSDTTEATVPATVTIPAGQSSATFDINAVDDWTVDGTKEVTVTATAPGYGEGSDAVNVIDDDTAGITVGPTAGLTTTEVGGNATFTIVLHSQPTADLTIGLTSSDTTEGTVAPASVTFTSANWNTAQTVTVTGVNDELDDGDVAYTILTAAATSADAKYSGLNAADVSVTNTDNDTAGIMVNPTGGLVTSESGGTATFTIVLNTQPTANVTIGLTSGDATEGTVSPASVTFTAANWNMAQTVTVTCVNDDLADGDVTYTILTAAATSTDTNYSGLNAADVFVTNTDNDTAGITVNPTGGLVTSESGGTATFTIVLNSQPTADVAIGLTSGDATEGTVSPASVMFTAANWNAAQTVTVTGVNDDLDDGDVTYTILTAAATSTDTNYSGLNAADVSVTNTDNDTAGITVNPTGGLVTSESGGTATFTIVLNTQPTADVAIGLTSSDTSEGTVSPTSVTFASGNWKTPQTVTVSGVNDDLADGDVGYTIVTAAATSSDANYNSLNASDVSVTNTDNDTAGITVSPAGGLITTEAGGTAAFTFVLNTQPTANVTIGVSSSDASEGTVSPASVMFTAGNWNTPQVVTVSGVNDDMDDGDAAYTIVTAAAFTTDVNYNGLNAADVWVTNTNDDTAGITVTPISGETTEGGGTATFSLVLDTQPTADVVIGVSSSDLTEGLVWPTSMTFTTTNWNVVRTVTVTGENDSVDDGDLAFTVLTGAATSTDANYSGLNATDVSVTNLDNDTAGITISAISRDTTEAAGTATFTIVLNSQPTADVTIGLSSSDVGEGSVTPASVTFTAANWSISRIVTVGGVNDDLDDGDVEYTIVTAAATSMDQKYNNLNAPDVSVINTDNDEAGFTVFPTSGLITTEGGDTATFTVVLTAEPTSNVVLSVTSNTTETTVDAATLTFTAANWNEMQTVTIGAADDGLVDGAVASTVTLSVVDASSDNAWGALVDQTVSVTTNDDDVPGFTLSKTAVTVTEPNTADTFTVVLTRQPLTEVVFTLVGSDLSEATVSPALLTFTSANWNVARPVTVTAADDVTVDGAVTSTVIVSVHDASSDNAWDALADETVTVATNDDDGPGFTLSKTALTVTEPSTADTFTVVLTKQPLTDVVFTLVGSDVNEATVSPTLLTFTSANWNVAQLVTVTAADDMTVDGAVTSTVTVSVHDASSDNAWDALADQTVSVTTNDDDVPGFMLNKTAMTVTEPSTADTFTVVLTRQPLTEVVFTLVGSDLSEATVSPALLTFTSANWNVARPVTVTAADDVTVDGAVTSTVIVSVHDASSDNAWDALADETVTVTTNDDDGPGFTLSKTAVTVTEPSTADTFTVVLTKQPLTDVVFTVVARDLSEAMVSPALLTFTSANWNVARPVTVTAADDVTLDGAVTSTVTVSVHDASSDNAWDALADETVSVTTNDDDVPGFLLSKTALTVTEPSTADTFTVVLTKQPLTDVVFTLVGSDVNEATVSPTLLTFTSANWNVARPVTVTAADDMTVDGAVTSTVTVSVHDASSDNAWDALADETVTVTTNDDDGPGFTLSKAAVTVTEPNTADTFTVVLTRQPLTDVVFTVVAGDLSEATVSPALLTFTSANWNVAQPVTVTAADDVTVDGAVTSTVTVSVHDASSDNAWDALADKTVTVTTNDDDGGSAGFTLSKTAVTVTEPSTADTFTVVLTRQPLTDVVFTVVAGDLSEATVSPALLTFTSANWNVAQPVTVTAGDDVTVDGAVTSTVTVSVHDASSDDAWDALADQAVMVTTIDNDVGWCNPRTPFDTDNSGRIDAADVLVIINYINAHSNDPSLPPLPASPPPYYDVNDDGLCTPSDVLQVINYINSHGSGGSGEGESALRAATAPDAAPSIGHYEGTLSGSVNMQFVLAFATGRQVAGEPVSRPTAATPPGQVSTSALSRLAADSHPSARPSWATGSMASPQSAALDAALETWEQGIDDDLVAVLADDLGRDSC